MVETDWDILAELFENLAALPGSWEEKKEMIEVEIARRGASSALEEFLSWFSD